MSRKELITYSIMALIIAVLTVNTVMVCLLTLRINEDRKTLRNFKCDIADIKLAVEKEIQLRQELFPQLKKSAGLLQQYNPRLDTLTALRYAWKIHECSDDLVSMEVLTALIVVESSADFQAVSSKGALGLTQVMPKVWNYDRNSLIDPYKNIEIGASILRGYAKRHGLVGGLNAYNSGSRRGAPRYAKKVLRIAKTYF